MQVMIVGDMCIDRKKGAARMDDLGEDLSLVENTDKAVTILKQGFIADIIICGPEIDTEQFSESLDHCGISTPAILQYERSAQLSADFTSWLGNETNPLRLGQSLVEMERNLILQTLTHCGGNRTYAADILGISSRTLRSKLQQYSAEGCTVIAPRVRQSPHPDLANLQSMLVS